MCIAERLVEHFVHLFDGVLVLFPLVFGWGLGFCAENFGIPYSYACDDREVVDVGAYFGFEVRLAAGDGVAPLVLREYIV